MVTMFYDIIHKSIKLYVNVILEKSNKKENNLEYLRVIFWKNNIIQSQAKS